MKKVFISVALTLIACAIMTMAVPAVLEYRQHVKNKEWADKIHTCLPVSEIHVNGETFYY